MYIFSWPKKVWPPLVNAVTLTREGSTVEEKTKQLGGCLMWINRRPRGVLFKTSETRELPFLREMCVTTIRTLLSTINTERVDSGYRNVYLLRQDIKLENVKFLSSYLMEKGFSTIGNLHWRKNKLQIGNNHVLRRFKIKSYRFAANYWEFTIKETYLSLPLKS